MAFVLAAVWLERGGELVAIPSVLDSSASHFWFSVEDENGLAVCVWHDYSPLDATIELSVAFVGSGARLGFVPLIGDLRWQAEHVALSVPLHMVVARTCAALACGISGFALDGVIPEMITDRTGAKRDVCFYSASPADILVSSS